MLEKQIINEEHGLYPEVLVRCEDCGQEFSGKIGPLETEDSYPLVKYIWPNPLLRALITHHNTVRHFSNGHNSFAVYQGSTFVGKAKVSSNTQLFVRTKST